MCAEGWLRCGSCGHNVMPLNAKFKCVCSKCEAAQSHMFSRFVVNWRQAFAQTPVFASTQRSPDLPRPNKPSTVFLVVHPMRLLTVPKNRVYRVPMNFEEQIRELCQRVVACESDEEATELSRQMKALLHGKIEELRGDWSRVSQRTPPTVVE